MQKIYYSGMEDGGEYQTRTSEFFPIENYQIFITEFEQIYSGVSDNLFKIYKSGKKISVIAYDHILHNEFMDDSDDSRLISSLKENGISDIFIDFLKEKREDFFVSDLIEKIALPDQKIKVQITDTLYGNSEFEINTLKQVSVVEEAIDSSKAESNEYIKNNAGVIYLDLTNIPSWKEILKSITSVTTIHQVYLDGNNIETIDDVMDDLLKFKNTLWFIELSNNKILKLPINFHKLSKLKSLEYRKNGLESIPEEVFKLKKLEYLNVSLNPLKTISDSISNLENLKFFILKNKDEIADIGNGLGALVDLRQLYIRTKLSKIYSQLLKLEKLELLEDVIYQDEDVTYLDFVKYLTKIKNVQLRYVNKLKENFSNDEELEIQSNIVSRIDSSSRNKIDVSVLF
jgi:Leucine-rich repeat (LRR) protein